MATVGTTERLAQGSTNPTSEGADRTMMAAAMFPPSQTEGAGIPIFQEAGDGNGTATGGGRSAVTKQSALVKLSVCTTMKETNTDLVNFLMWQLGRRGDGEEMYRSIKECTSIKQQWMRS
jgi:hypothetical protein